MDNLDTLEKGISCTIIALATLLTVFVLGTVCAVGVQAGRERLQQTWLATATITPPPENEPVVFAVQTAAPTALPPNVATDVAAPPLGVTPSPSPTPPPPPTVTPTPIGGVPTPATAPSDSPELRTIIEMALGPSDRGLDRVTRATLDDGVAAVVWTINERGDEEVRRNQAQLDLTNMLQAMDEAGVAYQTATFVGTYPRVNASGNTVETAVVEATFAASAVDNINWDQFLFGEIYRLAADVQLAPAFQTGSAPEASDAGQPAIVEGNAAPAANPVGQAVTVGPFIVTVNEVLNPSGNETISPAEGNRFVVVDLTIENTSAETVNLSTLQMTVEDEAGQQYGLSTNAVQAANGLIPGGELLAGEQLRGQLGYEVPATSSLTFVIGGAAAGGNNQRVPLP